MFAGLVQIITFVGIQTNGLNFQGNCPAKLFSQKQRHEK
jgi:hypothetical protein